MLGLLYSRLLRALARNIYLNWIIYFVRVPQSHTFSWLTWERANVVIRIFDFTIVARIPLNNYAIITPLHAVSSQACHKSMPVHKYRRNISGLRRAIEMASRKPEAFQKAREHRRAQVIE